MGVYKCVDCGGLVSTRADRCPHCGCPIKFIMENGTEQEIGNSIGSNIDSNAKTDEQLIASEELKADTTSDNEIVNGVEASTSIDCLGVNQEDNLVETNSEEVAETSVDTPEVSEEQSSLIKDNGDGTADISATFENFENKKKRKVISRGVEILIAVVIVIGLAVFLFKNHESDKFGNGMITVTPTGIADGTNGDSQSENKGEGSDEISSTPGTSDTEQKPTSTPVPTNTPIPTNTKAPTNTPLPTNTADKNQQSVKPETCKNDWDHDWQYDCHDDIYTKKTPMNSGSYKCSTCWTEFSSRQEADYHVSQSEWCTGIIEEPVRYQCCTLYVVTANGQECTICGAYEAFSEPMTIMSEPLDEWEE